MTSAYMPAAKSVDHLTPKQIACYVNQYFGTIHLDPFSSRSEYKTIHADVHYYGDDKNGLIEPWAINQDRVTNVFLNPPYGRFMNKVLAKIDKEIEEGNFDKFSVIGLFKASTDTRWFQNSVAQNATGICFIKSRVHYIDGLTGKEAPAPFASMLVFWEPDLQSHDYLIDCFSPLGFVVGI